MITKDEFLRKYNISKDFFADADISWEDLITIYHDYKEKKGSKCKKILLDFEGE